MASGVLKLQGQMSCNWVVDQTLIDRSTSNFPSNYFEDKVFEVQGELSVDQNTYFSNCIFYMSAGSSIVVYGVELTIDDCKFGCEEWEGISGSGLFISRNSHYYNYNTAFLIGGASAGIFTGNIFQSDGTGIGIDANALSFSLFSLFAGIFSTGNTFNDCVYGIRGFSTPLGIFDNNSTYNDCLNGIWINQSNAYVNDSKFIDCTFGIYCHNSSQINMVGSNTINNFENCANGVSVLINSEANIINSKFLINSSVAPASIGIHGFSNSNINAFGCSYNVTSMSGEWQQFIGSYQCRVEASNNIINMPNVIKSHGFHCGVSPHIELSNNTVSVNSPNVAPNSSSSIFSGANYFTAIDRLLIHNNNTFNSNITVFACRNADVFDNTFDYNNEIYSVFGSTINNLFCNNIFKGGHSLRLESSCYPTEFRTSDFIDAESGFEINGADLGPVYHRGNKWNATSFARKLKSDNTKFYVNPDLGMCANPEYRPENILPNDDWFQNIPGCVNDACFWDISFSIGIMGGTDSSIVNNTYAGSDLSAWYQKLNTFEKLWKNPGLMDGYSAAENFYENSLATDIEAITKVHWFLEASRQHDTYSPMLETRNGQKLAKLEEINELNGLLAISFDSTNAANLAVKVGQLSTIHTQINILITDLAEHKTEMLDSAEHYNDLISGTLNTFVDHEKFINAMVIEKERDPDFTPESEELEDILEVAILCPVVYGKCVYLARSFFTPAELEAELGEIEPCTEELISSQKNRQISSFIIIPNPVRGGLFIDGIDQNEKYSYRILDAYGKLILSGNYNNPISTAILEQGIYFLILSDQNGIICINKFIKH